MNFTKTKEIVNSMMWHHSDHNKVYGATIGSKPFCGYRGRNTWPSKQGLTKALLYNFSVAAQATKIIPDPWWRSRDFALASLKDAIECGYIKIIEFDLTE